SSFIFLLFTNPPSSPIYTLSLHDALPILISRKATKRQTRLLTKVDSATQLVDGMIVTLRRIASELRPRTLDDLGLAAALEGQAQEFETRTRIRCRVALPEESLILDSERSTAIF